MIVSLVEDRKQFYFKSEWKNHILMNNIKKYKRNRVHIGIPKFNFKYSYDIKKLLLQLGLSKNFYNSDVDKIIYNAVVEVNEIGNKTGEVIVLIKGD